MPEKARGYVLLTVLLYSIPGAGDELAADPMRPDGYSNRPVSQAQPVYRLDALFAGGGRRVAIVNGKTYREGETRDGLTLVSTDSESAVIDTPEGRRTVTLNRRKSDP